MNSPAIAGHTAPARPIPQHSPLIQLSKLAHFQTGYSLRSEQKHPQGAFAVIQSKDVHQGVLAYELDRANIPDLPADQALQVGDVLLHARDAQYHAMVFDAAQDHFICAAPLLVIRLQDQASLLPSYLAWYLNTSAAQKMLSTYVGQGTPDEVNMEGLYMVQVLVPSVARQQQIIDLAALSTLLDSSAQTMVPVANRHRQPGSPESSGKTGIGDSAENFLIKLACFQ